ncbi:unnamed protein product [Cuscuta campestris]|uniref:Uncharacterized protein n=1 Tax=Cuscuta campestris TaxID=132261 RepID=A0A484KGI4_9ASTE|nr:unnamed protein product [Cuscuta campestris]
MCTPFVYTISPGESRERATNGRPALLPEFLLRLPRSSVVTSPTRLPQSGASMDDSTWWRLHPSSSSIFCALTTVQQQTKAYSSSYCVYSYCT